MGLYGNITIHKKKARRPDRNETKAGDADSGTKSNKRPNRNGEIEVPYVGICV